MKFLKLSLFAACAILTSCGSSDISSSYEQFASRADYKKTYQTYKHPSLLDTERGSAQIIIDKSDQRLLLVKDDTVLLDTPCTTGRAGKRTPSGSFKISEKIVNKRSSIFGRCYGSSGRVFGGDRRKSPFRCNRYVGAGLPNWQRLTSDGIGLHASGSVKRYPASAGCIRLQPSTAKFLFSKTNKGDRVIIRD